MRYIDDPKVYREDFQWKSGARRASFCAMTPCNLAVMLMEFEKPNHGLSRQLMGYLVRADVNAPWELQTNKAGKYEAWDCSGPIGKELESAPLQLVSALEEAQGHASDAQDMICECGAARMKRSADLRVREMAEKVAAARKDLRRRADAIDAFKTYWSGTSWGKNAGGQGSGAFQYKTMVDTLLGPMLLQIGGGADLIRLSSIPKLPSLIEGDRTTAIDVSWNGVWGKLPASVLARDALEAVLPGVLEMYSETIAAAGQARISQETREIEMLTSALDAVERRVAQEQADTKQQADAMLDAGLERSPGMTV